MRRDQLEHLIRAAGAILGDDELIVIGSQSIVGSTDGPLPPITTLSIGADLLPLDDPDGEKLDLIDGTIGELSMFHDTFGIYARGVVPTTARLPEGWRDRLIPLRDESTHRVTGLCLDPTDLVVSKLLARRPKDIDFCTAVLGAGLVRPEDVLSRVAATDATPAEIEHIEGLLRRAGGS